MLRSVIKVTSVSGGALPITLPDLTTSPITERFSSPGTKSPKENILVSPIRSFPKAPD